LLLGVLLAVVLGCEKSSAQVESSDPHVVSGTLARIKKTGTVRIGYRDSSIPSLTSTVRVGRSAIQSIFAAPSSTRLRARSIATT